MKYILRFWSCLRTVFFFGIFLKLSWILCVSNMTLRSVGGRQVKPRLLLYSLIEMKNLRLKGATVSPHSREFHSRKGASGRTRQRCEDIFFYPLTECYEPCFRVGGMALALLSLCSFVPFSTLV